MRRYRNYRWPFGFWGTTLITLPFTVPALWGLIYGYFWVVAYLGERL